MTILKIASIVACIAVAIVLMMGLWNLLRGGSPNRSQALMRMRVAMQAIALVILMATAYFSR